ncbi:MAG: aspartate carbamoyltransferase regulatory subunit [Patescibacteria group bacterium]
MNKTLSVSAIENGTVIDHITAGNALKIIRLLRLPEKDRQVTVGLNLKSHAMGRKDLIKVEDHEVTEEEAGRIAILTPRATINIIKKFAVKKKFIVQIPERIDRVLVCPNHTCITNHEKMSTSFLIHPFKKEFHLACRYCERIFLKDEITDYRT